MGNKELKYLLLLVSVKTEDKKIILQDLIDAVFQLCEYQQSKSYTFQELKTANLLGRMVFTKLSSIKTLLEGFTYSSQGKEIKINDFTILASNIRNLLENICIFHFIFKKSKSEEETILKLKVWEISSLKYRLYLKKYVKIESQKEKIDEDEKKINEISLYINNLAIIKNLDEINKKKLDNMIDRKSFSFLINNNKIKCYDWQDMVDEISNSNEAFNSLYTNLSMYSHPSYKSVNDFNFSFFNENKKEEIIKDLMYFCFILTSYFINDFRYVFPKTKELEINKIVDILLNMHKNNEKGL